MAKKKTKKKATVKAKGRPKRNFTDEQVAEMEKYAFAGCQNNTIATLMDIPMNTLLAHFGKLLTKKRCERKYELRAAQNKLAASNVAMAIFLGKNELDQADKQELTGAGGGPIVIVDFSKVGK